MNLKKAKRMRKFHGYKMAEEREFTGENTLKTPRQYAVKGTSLVTIGSRRAYRQAKKLVTNRYK